MKPLPLLLAVLAAAPAAADPGIPFRNTDATAVFLWWPAEAGQTLGLRPLPVFPGERQVLPLGPGGRGTGVFLPTSPRADYTTVLAAGNLTAADRPPRGSLTADRNSWASARGGRGADAPLQAWGLVPPAFVLDGAAEGDAPMTTLLEWGPGFLPGGQPWNRNRPKPKSLSAAEDEGVLWLRLVGDRPWSAFPAGAACSLVLRSEGLLAEVPLTGGEGTVWVWGAAPEPVAAGRTVRAGDTAEAALVWDRLPPGTRKAWAARTWTWELAVTENDAVRSLGLGGFSFGDLP